MGTIGSPTHKSNNQPSRAGPSLETFLVARIHFALLALAALVAAWWLGAGTGHSAPAIPPGYCIPSLVLVSRGRK